MIVVIRGEYIEAIAVGDTGVVAYDSAEVSVPFFMEQQVRSKEPTNYLGRKGEYIPSAGPGVFGQYFTLRVMSSISQFEGSGASRVDRASRSGSPGEVAS